MSVSLSKGQKISLEKPGGGTLSRVRMGLGWSAVKKKGLLGRLMSSGSIDLDASCLMFDATKNLVDQVWFRQLKSKDHAVVHTGDNLTGSNVPGGDDESILVDLTRLSKNITTLVFVVNSFTGQSFSQIENAHCRLVDDITGVELARFQLSGSGPHTAQIMAKVTREGNNWAMTAIGAIANGRTFQALLPEVNNHL